MFSKLMDRLFGKRYRKGWPRGVMPVAQGLERLKRERPELWQVVEDMPALEAIEAIRQFERECG